ncbi:STAS domain-containing protein [Peribacillus sp. SCS-155]|uniref:STAS domain-containing protein n=1 Tax=Peribacillus sedimenti TaxID=3115297 RepID=UPI0039062E0E
METAKLLGKQIVEQQLELSRGISTGLKERYNQFLGESGLEDLEIVKWRGKLIGYIGTALMSLDTDSVWDEVTDWSRQTGQEAVNYGISIDQLLSTNKVYRTVIWDFLKEHIDKENARIDTILKMNEILDSIMDHAAYLFSVSYVENYKKTLSMAREAIVEISTPVVSLSDEIAILPLVGELDTDRARILMETSLERCASIGNSELIIDLSGVPVVDTMVASELFQVANALKMIGVKPTFTGIRPEIAQAMVGLGIDFKDIQTMGSLKQAIAKINKLY